MNNTLKIQKRVIWRKFIKLTVVQQQWEQLRHYYYVPATPLQCHYNVRNSNNYDAQCKYKYAINRVKIRLKPFKFWQHFWKRAQIWVIRRMVNNQDLLLCTLGPKKYWPNKYRIWKFSADILPFITSLHIASFQVFRCLTT